MKITEQRLKEIIKEEIQKENIFKKMFKMKGKDMHQARQLIQPVIDAWIQGGYEDKDPTWSKHKRAFSQFENDHDPNQALSYAKTALERTYDPREQREFKQYVKTLWEIVTKIQEAE